MMLHSHITAAATGRGYSRRPGGHAHRAAGIASQPPSAFMNGPMAASAHEDQVADARFAALDPVLEVVGISPAGRAAAAWELAVAISQTKAFPGAGSTACSDVSEQPATQPLS